MKLEISTSNKRRVFIHSTFFKVDDDNFTGYAICGAGCGNDLVEFVMTDKKSKETIRENFKMSDVYEQWAEKMRKKN